ncbi:MAG TPA: DUF262 domain-containing protein [Geminicoccaceae bacterium]|nr:DUF262 domain-containing protein [Geminicoccaceae bacterium]
MTQTIFTKVDYTLGGLVGEIELGSIGLPDIQRPFVWQNAKVRNLLDSMYWGFPVGYLLFWANANADDSRAIGTDGKQRVPQLLIVDGQQRLTSLYAVIKGVPVIRENYEPERIEIAFNPLLEKFDVTDAAIRRDKTYIADISTVWAKGTNLFALHDQYLKGLPSDREITDDDRRRTGQAFSRLQNLVNFPFTTLTLAAAIDEEQVSEVFVRINSQGKSLNQADFILTLMSVFWDEGRAQLEDFCRRARRPTAGKASPFNHFIQPGPDQLLRVSVGLGFRRARLQAVYSVLRGKDLDADRFDAERRDAQFAILKAAQARVVDLQHWQDFFLAVRLAGFRSGQMITSQNNLLFAYILYLLGRTEFGVDRHELKRLIATWFFMSALTGRYTSSPESRMEFDLAGLRGVRSAEAFASVLRGVCDWILTHDYWSITLPMDLATSAARSPSLYAYIAALNLLDARALFSAHRVAELTDPTTQANRSAVERHHLFPKAHLAELDVTDMRETNQSTNYALVEWGDNSAIGAQSPQVYLPTFRARFDAADYTRMAYWHALPDGWQDLPYPEFLRQRRDLMARVIRDAYRKLAGDQAGDRPPPARLSVDQLVEQGESTATEFKATLRVNLHTGQKDPRMELAVLKTIAAFLNGAGGTLVVGVKDDGEPLGIGADGFPDEDKMNLHLVNLVNERIGAQHFLYVHPRFDDFEGVRVVAVGCKPSRSAVFVKDGNTERFYARTGAATAELTGQQMQAYIKQRFSA